MLIKLYKVSCSPNVVNKTDFLTSEYVISNARPNDSCEMLTPTLVVHWFNGISNYNYVYIDTFDRYYYITGVTMLSGERCLLSCAVDVLHTYHSSIAECKGTVIRAEKPKSRNIHDSKYPVINQMESTSTLFPVLQSPFTAANGWNYVLTVVGGGEST